MMAQASRMALIAKVNKKYPECCAVPSERFDSSMVGGIWFRQEGRALDNGLPIYDYYEDPDHQVNPDLARTLNESGWFAEPYDAGTLMAFPV